MVLRLLDIHMQKNEELDPDLASYTKINSTQNDQIPNETVKAIKTL